MREALFKRSQRALTAGNLYADFKEAVPLARDVAAWRDRWLRHRQAGLSVFLSAVRATTEAVDGGEPDSRAREAR